MASSCVRDQTPTPNRAGGRYVRSGGDKYDASIRVHVYAACDRIQHLLREWVFPLLTLVCSSYPTLVLALLSNIRRYRLATVLHRIFVLTHELLDGYETTFGDEVVN